MLRCACKSRRPSRRAPRALEDKVQYLGCDETDQSSKTDFFIHRATSALAPHPLLELHAGARGVEDATGCACHACSTRMPSTSPVSAPACAHAPSATAAIGSTVFRGSTPKRLVTSLRTPAIRDAPPTITTCSPPAEREPPLRALGDQRVAARRSFAFASIRGGALRLLARLAARRDARGQRHLVQRRVVARRGRTAARARRASASPPRRRRRRRAARRRIEHREPHLAASAAEASRRCHAPSPPPPPPPAPRVKLGAEPLDQRRVEVVAAEVGVARGRAPRRRRRRRASRPTRQTPAPRSKTRTRPVAPLSLCATHAATGSASSVTSSSPPAPPRRASPRAAPHAGTARRRATPVRPRTPRRRAPSSTCAPTSSGEIGCRRHREATPPPSVASTATPRRAAPSATASNGRPMNRRRTKKLPSASARRHAVGRVRDRQRRQLTATGWDEGQFVAAQDRDGRVGRAKIDADGDGEGNWGKKARTVKAAAPRLVTLDAIGARFTRPHDLFVKATNDLAARRGLLHAPSLGAARGVRPRGVRG